MIFFQQKLLLLMRSANTIVVGERVPGGARAVNAIAIIIKGDGNAICNAVSAARGLDARTNAAINKKILR